MKRISIVFCLILAVVAFSATVRAQQPVPVSPVLTEVEQLKLENINLRFTALQQQIQQVQQQAQQLVVAIEAAHPGFNVNFQTGQLTPKPKPVEPPKAATAPAPEKK